MQCSAVQCSGGREHRHQKLCVQRVPEGGQGSRHGSAWPALQNGRPRLTLLALQSPSSFFFQAEEPEAGKSEAEDDEDEIDDLPSSRRHWRGPISRKASQTSVYLQEWDIPFEQVELGEPIGQGRWGRVHRGRWHGEVAIRLLEMDGHNQDHLKLFKKEVMNYRQTRHENVVLFMGACMNPPHLAIITR